MADITIEDSNLQIAAGSINRVAAIRLTPGEDVLAGLIKACSKADINNGIVVCGIGSLDGAVFLNPIPIAGKKSGYGYGKAMTLYGPIELVSMSGMICQGEGKILPHIHCSFSDQYGNGHGGHLIEGNKVLMTVDIAVLELEGIHMGRRYDEDLEVHIFDPKERKA